MSSKVIEFPASAELAYRRIAKSIEADDSLSQFMRDELSKRIPCAIRSIAEMRVHIDVPREFSSLTQEQSAALAVMTQQVCEQYAGVFMGALAGAITKHVALIEDLRKRGINVELRGE